ncbi:MAG: hypothetical protein Hals2KO_21760 [Halioglobus sp.]
MKYPRGAPRGPQNDYTLNKVSRLSDRRLKKIKELQALVDELQQKVRHLEERQRWISVRERLPQVADGAYRGVEIWHDGRRYYKRYYYPPSNEWRLWGQGEGGASMPVEPEDFWRIPSVTPPRPDGN